MAKKKKAGRNAKSVNDRLHSITLRLRKSTVAAIDAVVRERNATKHEKDAEVKRSHILRETVEEVHGK